MVISPMPAVSNWADSPGSKAKIRSFRETGSGKRSALVTRAPSRSERRVGPETGPPGPPAGSAPQHRRPDQPGDVVVIDFGVALDVVARLDAVGPLVEA